MEEPSGTKEEVAFRLRWKLHPGDLSMMPSVMDKTIEIIAAKSGVDREKIDPNTALSTLELESLDMADIVFELEDEFDIEIQMNTAEAWDNLKTVSDIADSVSKLVAKDK